jgi:hypothetical protein
LALGQKFTAGCFSGNAQNSCNRNRRWNMVKRYYLPSLSTIGIYIVLETYLYTSSTQSRAGLFHSGGVGGCDSQGCSIAYKAVLRNWLHSNRRVYWASRRFWHSSLLCDASNILGTSFEVTTSDIIQFEDFCIFLWYPFFCQLNFWVWVRQGPGGLILRRWCASEVMSIGDQLTDSAGVQSGIRVTEPQTPGVCFQTVRNGHGWNVKTLQSINIGHLLVLVFPIRLSDTVPNFWICLTHLTVAKWLKLDSKYIGDFEVQVSRPLGVLPWKIKMGTGQRATSLSLKCFKIHAENGRFNKTCKAR